MNEEILLLAATAAAVGFVHTLMGPDHYVPFIALARIRGWSLARTGVVTLACGVGHVLSSVLLGTVGIAAGVAVSRLEAVEALRGDLAAWLLITIGLVYLTWGLSRALRSQGERRYQFPSRHQLAADQDQGHSLTPWVLFIAFALGPCEPLIPVFMVPAARESLAGVVLVTAVFAAATLGTMLLAVAVGYLGLRSVPLGPVLRFRHALAGGAILACGIGIQLLGV